jgi:hypothetical protein
VNEANCGMKEQSEVRGDNHSLLRVIAFLFSIHCGSLGLRMPILAKWIDPMLTPCYGQVKLADSTQARSRPEKQ